jgi:hypothetical protein
MTPEQVKQLVEQHPNLSPEQKDKILNNLRVVTLAKPTGGHHLKQYGATVRSPVPVQCRRCLDATRFGNEEKTLGPVIPGLVASRPLPHPPDVLELDVADTSTSLDPWIVN